MKNLIFALIALAGLHNGMAQGFVSPPLQWNIPAVLDNDEYRIADSYHTVIDMNGDGKPDLIDSENQATNGSPDPFLNGQQKYWKVYLNTNAGFSPTAVQWNLPAVLDDQEYTVASYFHTVADMNGDGLPDLIDTENEATNSSDVFMNGQQKYWKVYLNNGSGFNANAIQWNIPAVLDDADYSFANSYHTVMDMNGDGKPDLVDSENQSTENVSDVFLNGQQKYWKVYLNNGSGFNATAVQWNIPAVLDSDEYQVSYTLHVVMDMNGDGKPDLVDSENEATNGPADVFINGQQKYWKVYLNNGTGFNANAIQWNIPAVLDTEDYFVSRSLHMVIDFNGDGKPDLIDSENEATNGADVFLNGQQRYWKVYLNNGAGFNAASVQWNIPATLDTEDYFVAYTLHTVVDFNGDLKPDLIDTENEATNGPADVFVNGQQKYWRVYLNNATNLGTEVFESNPQSVIVYPNPVQHTFKIGLENAKSVILYDLTGTLVKTISGDLQQSIDISDLQDGIYILQVVNETGAIFNQRLIKQ